MPWRQVPMKDVVHCEKRWRAVCRRNSQRCPNGETRQRQPLSSRKGGEPGELKHLSSPRKRKDSASSGERKRRSPNRLGNGAGL